MKVARNEGAGSGATVGILKLFNRLFIVAVVWLAAYLAFRYMQQPPLPRIDVADAPFQAQGPGAVNRTVFDDQAGFFDFYNRIAGRDIFESPWEKPQPIQPDVEPAPAPPKIALPPLESLIRIAGIVVDQENSQAIVEDLRGGEVKFMREGQEVHGARLAEIREDRVVFIYDEERVELKP